MGGCAHSREALADERVHFVAVRGEHVLGEAALQRLRDVEVHVVAAERRGRDLAGVEQAPVHGVHHVNVGIYNLLAACIGAGLGQDDRVLAHGHGIPHC